MTTNVLGAKDLDRIDAAAADAAQRLRRPIHTLAGDPVPEIAVIGARALRLACDGAGLARATAMLAGQAPHAGAHRLATPVALEALETSTERAFVIAASAHAAQTRKHGTVPYIAHPLAIALHLAICGYSLPCVDAALLHDVVEDTQWTHERLGVALGACAAETLAFVHFATEPDKRVAWRIRKEGVVEKLRHASREQRALVVADKAHNLRDLLRAVRTSSDNAWASMRAGRAEQSWFAHALAATIRACGADGEEPCASFVVMVDHAIAHGQLEGSAQC